MDINKLIQNEFSRHLGLLTEEEQEKLLKCKVAVAGAGGVGGIHILTLARLGVGSFHIADFDEFGVENISRQFGANQQTIGKNKAEVLADMVKAINPMAETKIFKEGVTTENVDDFLAGVDVFVDGIEFFVIDIRRLVFQKAFQKGIYSVTAAPLGFGSTIQVFSPTGMSFDDYFDIRDDMEYLQQLAAFAAGLAPNSYHIKYMDFSKVSVKERRGPAVGLACTQAASFVAAEVVKIITGKEKIYPVPHYMQIDLLRRKFKKGYVWLGGKNPLQRLKKIMILKKFKEER